MKNMTQEYFSLVCHKFNPSGAGYYENHGGCGLVALEIYNIFKSKGLKCSLWSVGGCYNYKHVVVKVWLNNNKETCLFDSEGKVNDHGEFKYYHRPSSLQRGIDKDVWNNSFDRKNWPKVKKYLNEVLA